MLPWEGLVIGAGAGLFSGLFGIGGGIVIVPALLTMLSMDRRLAHGTSLAATIPVSLASLAVYSTSGNVDWIVAAFLAGGAVCGALVGTHLLQIVPKKPLTIIFIVVILITAARLLVPTEAIGRDELTFLGGMAFIAIGFVTGTLSGLLGIGGGVVMVPALVVLFSMPARHRKGHLCRRDRAIGNRRHDTQSGQPQRRLTCRHRNRGWWSDQRRDRQRDRQLVEQLPVELNVRAASGERCHHSGSNTSQLNSPPGLRD